MTTLSSPNRIVWEYFLSLRLIEQSAKSAPSPEISRQQAALALVMSVTAVEVFINLWFRVRVEEGSDPEMRASLLKDLNERRSIEAKLKNWPKRYLGAELDLTSGAGAKFSEIKRKRNSIVHFTSTHETAELGLYSLHGMADTSEYDSLSLSDAEHAVEAAIGLISEIFRLAGLSSTEIAGAMHGWTGTITD